MDMAREEVLQLEHAAGREHVLACGDPGDRRLVHADGVRDVGEHHGLHGFRAAFEFRHASWFTDEVYQALADHGAALVTADTGEGEAPVVATASFGYARLRRPGYDDGELARWAEALQQPAWSDAYVFFKHEDEGAGPRMAAGFREIWTTKPAAESSPASTG